MFGNEQIEPIIKTEKNMILCSFTICETDVIINMWRICDQIIIEYLPKINIDISFRRISTADQIKIKRS